MRVLICAGHTLRGKGTGANGYINESNENRILSKKIVEWLKVANIDVDYYEINEASDYLQKQVAVANKKSYDVVVQVHFNAYKTVNEAMGTETLYDKGSSKGREYAKRVNSKLTSIFKNRGAKERDDLYWLNNTKAPAILIETCFVDSKSDTDIYKKDKDRVAKAIAEGIINKTINSNANTSQSNNSTYTVKITTDVLNVRSGPGTEYKVTTKVKKGEVYTIVETSGNWGKLKSGAGWICLDYTSKNSTSNTIQVGSKVKVIGSNYATGQSIPSWVKQEIYTVSKIDGNKALINEITSWVYVKDLKLV